jgi:hypothetical protein
MAAITKNRNFLSSFLFVIKQKLTTKEISIFSNSSHFEWRAGLSDPFKMAAITKNRNFFNCPFLL